MLDQRASGVGPETPPGWGTLISRTSSVIAIANTPSLNASRRPVAFSGCGPSTPLISFTLYQPWPNASPCNRVRWMEVSKHTMSDIQAKTTRYNRFLLLVAGLGGLLYGVDVGIIGGALPYLEATSGLNAPRLRPVPSTGLKAVVLLPHQSRKSKRRCKVDSLFQASHFVPGAHTRD